MSRDVVRFYDRFAALYPVLNIFLRWPKRKLLARVNAEPSGRLLEVGVGRGDHLRQYAHRTITGIDMSEGMLAYARKRAPDHCTLQLMDASRLDFPNASFDYAVLSHVLSVVDEPSAVLDEVHRVVTPGGKIFILNHVSTGMVQQKLSTPLAPMTKILRFSSVFDLEKVINHQKFAMLDRGSYGLLPRITMQVMERL